VLEDKIEKKKQSLNFFFKKKKIVVNFEDQGEKGFGI
jgi:hypothetical protein